MKDKKNITLVFLISLIIFVIFIFCFYIFIDNKNKHIIEVKISREDELKQQRKLLIPDQSEPMTDEEYKQAIQKWGDKRIITIYAKPGDIDGDGISDRQEFLFGTNPFNYDTDDDGKMDSAEFANGSDPLVKD